MSQVHNVTDVPVHSLPLEGLAVAARAGVAGRNETVTKLESE